MTQVDTKELRDWSALSFPLRVGEQRKLMKDVLICAAELDALRARVAELESELLERKETHRKTVLELTSTQQQLAEAQSLIKRHEDALEGLFSQDGPINRIMHKKGFETYFLTSIRYANEPTLYYVHFDESEPDDNEEEFCFCGDTPLAAIEAAKGVGQ